MFAYALFIIIIVVVIIIIDTLEIEFNVPHVLRQMFY